MLSRKIMIVDDQIEIIDMIRLFLERENYKILSLDKGSEVIPQVKEHKPDLIILDILMPDVDGVELCYQLRKFTNVPIILISCKSEDIDKVIGLSAGGDDYLTKPFSPIELVARVKAHLRRSLPGHVDHRAFAPNPSETIHYGHLEINLLTQAVHVQGTAVVLSAREFKLLVQLSRHPGRIYSLDELYELVWGVDSVSDTRTVMVHVSNLRKKLNDVHSVPYIVTVRGAGYKLNEKLQNLFNRQG